MDNTCGEARHLVLTAAAAGAAVTAARPSPNTENTVKVAATRIPVSCDERWRRVIDPLPREASTSTPSSRSERPSGWGPGSASPFALPYGGLAPHQGARSLRFDRRESPVSPHRRELRESP